MTLVLPSLPGPQFCVLVPLHLPVRNRSFGKSKPVTSQNSIPWAVVIGLLLVLLVTFQIGQENSAPYSHFVVVFDAGSTGSRVHIFHFKTSPSSSSQPQLLGDEFHQVEPGLSSYATCPASAAASLDGLLKVAVKAVPASQRASTPCILRATAGLRQLEGTQSDDILAAVLELLQASPFKLDSESASILDGRDEGAFAWLTLNYLRGNLGKTPSATSTTIDLGGGSLQVAYAVDESRVGGEHAAYFKQVQGGGVTYSIYVHSYLGFGLMAARAAILEASADANACLPLGFTAQYPYGDKHYQAQSSAGGLSGPHCRESIVDVLQTKAACSAPAEECSFQGAWGGPGIDSGRSLVLFAYFWDRAEDVGIIKPDAIEYKIHLDKLTSLSNRVCSLSLEAVKSEYSHIEDDNAPYLCMDLSYCSTLLTHGLDCKATLQLELVKGLIYGGTVYKMGWALGAAINALQ